MSTITPDKAPACKVKVHAYGFGEWELPLLHEIEGAHEHLLAGNIDALLYEMPVELMTKMGTARPEDGARLILAWIRAGQDFEAAAWSAVCGLYDVLLLNENEEDESGDTGPYTAPLVEDAMALAEDSGRIADAVVSKWHSARAA